MWNKVKVKAFVSRQNSNSFHVTKALLHNLPWWKSALKHYQSLLNEEWLNEDTYWKKSTFVISWIDTWLYKATPLPLECNLWNKHFSLLSFRYHQWLLFISPADSNIHTYNSPNVDMTFAWWCRVSCCHLWLSCNGLPPLTLLPE